MPLRLPKVQILALALACTPFAPVHANSSGGFRAIAATQPVPKILNAKEKDAFTAIFAAIRSGKWEEAARMIDAAPQGPMSAMARAELYLAPNSPMVEV